MGKKNQFPEKFAGQSIVLPGSPFWEVFQTFGRDELIALVINTAATAAVSRLMVSNLLLSLSGPVVEKIGFFLAYLKEAFDTYRTTTPADRNGLFSYFLIAIKKGSVSLVKDVLVHDPIYTAFMYFGLKAYSQTPAWTLSIVSFVVAVGIVAVGEVGVKEMLFLKNIIRLKKTGFKLTSYFESRFFIGSTKTNNILEDFTNRFHLSVKAKTKYHDRYFETNLKSYNNRIPRLRFRQRDKEDGGFMQSVQIVYTRPSRAGYKRQDQFNFFPTKKDKLWFELKQEMPWKPEDIKDGKLREYCQKILLDKIPVDVFFERHVIRDPETILVSVDQVDQKTKNAYTVVEIKSYGDKKSKKMLIEAMRYLMLNYPALQTTHNKSMISSLNSH